ARASARTLDVDLGLFFSLLRVDDVPAARREPADGVDFPLFLGQTAASSRLDLGGVRRGELLLEGAFHGRRSGNARGREGEEHGRSKHARDLSSRHAAWGCTYAGWRGSCRWSSTARRCRWWC